jgi:pimeloyl-ACP methyl ester carboxylesterase
MVDPRGLTVRGGTHQRMTLNGAELHYVEMGADGPPVLLVHGFPETWWTFHKLMPLLAQKHRVFAVDLPGFGDSAPADEGLTSARIAEDLHALIQHIGLGPMHVSAQDISGGSVFRLAQGHPEDIASLTAIEMGLAGFGLEGFADVTHGGSWHIGVLAAPGIAEMLLAGRERDVLEWSFRSMVADKAAISETDIAEFGRGYALPGGWRGAGGLYRSMLAEGAEFRKLAEAHPLAMPLLAIGGGGGEFTVNTVRQLTSGPVKSVLLGGVGHYVAMEAPERLAEVLLDFFAA